VGGARAVALEASSGDIAVSLDDDAWLLAADSGERIAERFTASPQLAAVCLRVEAPDGTVRRREIPRRDKRMPADGEELGYFLGGAVALRSAALRETGGFPADMRYAAEEADIAFRLIAAGYRIEFAPTVRVAHEAIPSAHNTTDREANYVASHVRIAARFLPAPYAQVHASLWIANCLAQAVRTGHLAQTMRATREALASWRSCRAEGLVLDRATVKHLAALSARTWY
jgi:GT2 family glycosyltransferase